MPQAAKPRHGDAIYYGFTDYNKNEARNVRLQNLSADIGTPVEGLIFYRTDTDRVRVYDGATWKDVAWTTDVAAGTINQSIVDAKGDLIVGTAADTVSRLPAGATNTALFSNSSTGTGLEWRTLVSSDLPDNGVTYAKMQDVSAASRIIGRGSASGAGDPQELTVGGGVEISGTTIQTSAFTGDVTKTSGGTATTIANDVVTNTKLANMAANTIKGNNTGSVADPVDLTVAQVKTLLAYTATDIANFDTQVRTSRLDQMAAPTAAVNLNSQKITNLADGTVATDAATFGQLTAAITGQTWKELVDAATTANITLAGGAPNTLDGVTLAVGDRILVKNQTTASQNGIYTVQTLGTGATGTWVRSTDMDTSAEFTDATVLVQDGATHKGDIFTQTVAAPTVGTSNITWVQTGEGNTAYVADGTTIELNGNTFRVGTGAAGAGLSGGGGAALDVNAGTGLEISSDAIRIAAAAAGNGLTGGGGSALAVGAGAGITVTADAVAIDTSVVVRKAAGTMTGGANSEVLTHNLNTRDISKVTFVNASSPYDAIDDFYWEASSVNTVTVYAAANYNLPAGYRWVIIG